MEAVRHSLIFSWNWCYLRPFLKQLLPDAAHAFIHQVRRQFQPSLCQHPPIPLTIPDSYTHQPSFPSLDTLPVVSVVTPSLNQASFLEDTITSVIGQQYPKLEYIIRDGASTDGTNRILETYRSQLRHVESQPDRGQAHALNSGFRHARGDIMAWLNADDMFLPGAIPYVVNFFLEHPEVDVVYGHRICVDEKNREVGRWILPAHDDAILPWANYIPQETVFWRRSIWEKAGGYLDESYQFALDWDLFLRFQTAGATFVRLPRFLGAFRVHSTQKTNVLEHIGQDEAQRLHTQYHGRPVEWLEIRYHVRKYLARTAWLYVLNYLRSAKAELTPILRIGRQKRGFCTPEGFCTPGER